MCPSRAIFMLPSFLLQGLVPAGIRLMPHTVLTFVFLEQLRKHFGIKVPSGCGGAAGSHPAPCTSLFQSPGELAAEHCPEPSTCPMCSGRPLWPRTPTLACLASPVTIVPFRAAGFTSTSHRR